MFRHTLQGLVVLLAAASPARPDDRDPHTFPPAAKDILDRAEKLEVFSLHPERPDGEAKEAFRGWKVLGKTEVADAATRKQLAGAFVKGVTEFKGGPATCFDPRHGVRATAGGKTAEFVICFSCFQARVTVGEKDHTVYVSRSPATAFDAVLRKAGVALPPPADGK
ncbi:MAG: hypothetical protein U0804_08715 [Gemmataceae bacterium]